MFRALFISPMVPSTDVPATVRFLESALGFSARIYGTYAICERDGLTVHLQPAGEGAGPMSLYLEVDDIEAAWAAVVPHLGGLRHKAPHDRAYKMREAHVDLPHTQTLLFIGQCI